MVTFDIDKTENEINKLDVADIKQKIQKLTLLCQINQELAPVRELQSMLDTFIDKVISILKVEIGSLMLFDKMQNELRIKAARGLKEEIVRRAKIKLGEGISGWVAREAQPLLVEDISKDPRFKKRHGKKYSTNSLLTVPLIASGEVIGVLNVNNKVTKKVFNKKDLNILMAIANQAAVHIKNSREYERVARLNELKSEFVSVVSHELRNPLSAIKDAMHLLLDRIPGKINKKQEELLTLTRDNIDRLSRIVTGLLDLSRMEAEKTELKREFVDIVRVVKAAVNSFKPAAAKKSISLTAHIKCSTKGMWADSDRISQVLANLIGNAVKYTPGGGKIDVMLKKKGRSIEIAVKDTGRGISEEDLPRVFEKFTHLSVEDGNIISTGLGLSITKDIVELHKGSITVESKLRKGSQFIVNLPMDLRVVSGKKGSRKG